jgi:formylglycine-generating enzyme
MRIAALTGLAALLCAAACDSVLDIEEPKMRPGEAGQGGEEGPDTGGSNSGSATVQGGGGAGEEGGTSTSGAGGSNPITGGAGGDGGTAGETTPKDCEYEAVRCGGEHDKTPEVCDENGHWVQNTAEQPAGECEVLCTDGKCAQCKDGDKRCTACGPNEADCNSNLLQKCEGGDWKDDVACKHYCDAGTCVTPPSCELAFEERTTCKVGEKSMSCCSSLHVPGGRFLRNYDGIDYPDDSHEATLTAFHLDRFEVTVGRLRQFVNAFDAIKAQLEAGDGKSDHVVGDTGWSESYPLPASKTELIEDLKCEGGTWVDDATKNNGLPANCVPYSVAYAFCIWDGGRLPTDAEWNFAASGGDQQRTYPWKPGPEDLPIDETRAVYGATAPMIVGSKFAGVGLFGQLDLAGNVAEWALDFSGDIPQSCVDCVNTTPAAERQTRGGGYLQDESSVVAPLSILSLDPKDRRSFVGFRCAREVK